VQSGELADPPPDFTDPATAGGQRPADWFTTISDGRIEKLMPPWRGRLNEAERWSVAMYTYSLAYQPDVLALGQQVWAAECAECHGETGRGDGPDAAEINRPVGDLTDQSEIVTLSDTTLFNIVAEGVGENMPAFADDLSEEQRRAVVRYLRTFALANPDQIGAQVEPAATEEISAAGIRGTIRGIVANGTVGGEVPADLEVELWAYGDQFNPPPQRRIINPDGTFAFDGVDINAEHVYFIAMRYRDRVFASEFVQGDPANPDMELPVTFYELTEDPAVISIERMAMQVDAIGDGLQVAQVIFFSNSSDRLFTSSQALAEGQYPSVVIPLPPGSVIMGFGDNEERFVVLEDEPAVIDTASVLPGDEHIVQIVYFIPYEGSAIIEQEVNYSVNGPMRLLVSPSSVTATSEQLPALGPQTIGERTYESYGADLSLAPGAVIRYELRGQGAPVADVQPTTTTGGSNNLLAVLLLLLGGAALLVAAVLYLRGRNMSAVSKERLIDTLVREIADLDARHEAGHINHDLYQRQRSQLKARLAKLMEVEGD
jgi:mono/diheme cytochrome c family protein